MRKIFCNVLITNIGKALQEATIILDNANTIIDIIPNSEKKDSEYFSGIICPGFVNVHCHLELSHLKNKIDTKLGLVGFIQSLQSKRNVEESEITGAATIASEQMYQEGVDAVGDISNSIITKAVKENSKIKYHTFVEVFGFVPENAANIFSNAFELLGIFGENSSITAHAPYSVSGKLFELIKAQKPFLYTIHNQESEEENKFFVSREGNFIDLYKNFGVDISFFNKKGVRSFEVYKEYVNDLENVLLVHNTFSNESDFISMKKLRSKIFIGICANANLYIENKLPDISLMQKIGMKICIGTDSLASNWQLSMMEEMKIIKKYFPEISVEEIISWATINGAEFLKMPEFGKIQIGKKCTLVYLANTTLNGFSDYSKAQRII